MAPPPNTQIQPVDEAAIAAGVESSVDSSIKAETAPLETLASQTTVNRDKALEEIGQAFGYVVDAAKGSAVRLGQSYEDARMFEKGIFDAAMGRINAVKGEAAAEAQRMAQLTGGPVDLAAFIGPALVESGLAASDFAGGQLQSMGFGQANVALAESYAGATFPLMRAREKKQALNYFNDEIQRIRKEIAAIKQTKGSRVEEEKRKRLLEEREYQLARAQANRDWWAAQQGVAIEKKRTAIQEGDLTGTYKGEPTAAERDAAARRAADKAQAQSANRLSAGKMIEAVTTPGMQTYTQTQKVEASPGTAGAFQDPTSPTGWSQYKDVKIADTGGPAMTRPDEIYHYLLTNGIPPAIALAGVRNWLKQKGVSNAKTWVPGAAASPEKKDTNKPPTRPGKPGETVTIKGVTWKWQNGKWVIVARSKPTQEGTRPDSVGGGGGYVPDETASGGGPPTKPAWQDRSKKPFGGAEWRSGPQGTGWYWMNPSTGKWEPAVNG